MGSGQTQGKAKAAPCTRGAETEPCGVRKERPMSRGPEGAAHVAVGDGRKSCQKEVVSDGVSSPRPGPDGISSAGVVHGCGECFMRVCSGRGRRKEGKNAGVGDFPAVSWREKRSQKDSSSLFRHQKHVADR